MRRRRGQIALFLLFALVALVLLTLLNVDVFSAVREKGRLQDGGDAAALAAARRQGALLNEIGRLNADHLVAAALDRTNECREIVLKQRRLALLGPVDALRYADAAAKKNGMPVRKGFAKILSEHVRDVRTLYAGGGGFDPYPEPFPGAWTEYATAIEAVAHDGLAAGPDNIEFYDAPSGHPLVSRAFYNAVAARDWCWFWFFRNGLLESYGSYHDWPPVPTKSANTFDNSEIFSLHVSCERRAIMDDFSAEEIMELAERYAGDARVTTEDVERSALLRDPAEPWFFFAEGAWGRWFNGLALADDPDAVEFPLAGEVKPEYNVRGCAAVCRCAKTLSALAADVTSEVTWSAAAKPFGTVMNFDGGTDVATALKRFVLPCFTDVRLVPLDSVGGEDLATSDIVWVDHLRNHLVRYLEHGPAGSAACWYCRQLQTWENPVFRQTGAIWLKFNSGSCRRGDYGPGGHGGTSHGR